MWDKAFVALLAWFVAAYTFKPMWDNKGWRTGSITFYYWSFAFFFAVGLTFMIWPVYLAFNRLVGLPNLGWLLSYISFLIAVYMSSKACYLLLKQPPPRLLLGALVIITAVLTALYATTIVFLPEKVDHTIPEQPAEMLFMIIIYLYVAVFCLFPFKTFVQLFVNEKVLPAKIRWYVGAGSSLVATAVMVAKTVLTIVAFNAPQASILLGLQQLIGIGIVVVGFLMPMGFFPNSYYQAIARPFEFVGKLIALFELRALQRRLNNICPPIIEDVVAWSQMAKDLDFHLYRVLIGILDAKQTLAGYAKTTNNWAFAPDAATSQPWGRAYRWDGQKLRQAQLVYGILQKINDETEFMQLVDAYRKISHIHPITALNKRSAI